MTRDNDHAASRLLNIKISKGLCLLVISAAPFVGVIPGSSSGVAFGIFASVLALCWIYVLSLLFDGFVGKFYRSKGYRTEVKLVPLFYRGEYREM